MIREEADETAVQAEQVKEGNAIEQAEIKPNIQQLNEKYSPLFSEHEFDVGHTTVLECSIHLKPGTIPHHVPARRLSLKLQQDEVAQVNTLLIQPSFSEWAAGITFVCREGKTP